MTHNWLNVRRPVGVVGAGAILAGMLGSPGAAAASVGADPWAGVRHVIMFVGDGMQLEHEVAAGRYLNGRDFSLSFERFPYRTSIATWDVTTYNAYGSTMPTPVVYDEDHVRPLIGYDPAKGGAWPYPMQDMPLGDYFLKPIPPMERQPATDSAAAATAYATGRKTEDGLVSWLPGGTAVPTLPERLRRERGFSTGVVTTVPFDHATPAAFMAHNSSRDNYHALANEIVSVTKPDVLIGGGHPLWRSGSGRYGYIPQPMYDALATGQNQDYLFVERRLGVEGGPALLSAAQTAAAQGRRLFGLYGGSNGNVESPVPADAPGAPAVRPASVENPLLRDSTLAALTVLGTDPDGFFLMVEQGDIDWANHANDYARMVGTVWDLDEAVRSAVNFVNRPFDDINWQNTLLLVTADHANSGMRLNPTYVLGKGDLPAQPRPCKAPCVYPDGEVTYRTGDHTNELVRLYAMGAGVSGFLQQEGTWYPGTGILDNTQVFQAIRRATHLRPTAITSGR